MDETVRKDHRRGHQPALQLGPRAAGARHHGRRFRGARRLPPPAPLPARPRATQALEKSDLGALLVFDVNNIRYLTSTKIGEWERDKLSRWALLTRGRRTDPVGLRLGRRASQALFAVAQAGELQGRPRRPARHRRSGVRPDEAPRRGDRLDPARGRRRQHADRRRHHRAADDVRTGEGRAEDRRTASR